MKTISSGKEGDIILCMGNEAVARGGLEAGLSFLSTYPGTPASEIGEVFVSLKDEFPHIYAEFSINEHVAAHGAIGASWAGVRSMLTMKHVGMNVAAEPLHFLGYTGVGKGLVIIVGSDPGATCSTSEQDDRWYSLHTHIPILEPSNIQEAKNFTVMAFDLSERFNMPFIINTPTRLCHNIGSLRLGAMPAEPPAPGKFTANPSRYVNLFAGSVANHARNLDAIEKLREAVPTLGLNRIIPGSAKVGIISSSINYLYAMEALDLLGLHDVPVMKIEMSYPLNADYVARFVAPLETVYIVEELEGFLEFQIKSLLYDKGLRTDIRGKSLFPATGELNCDVVIDALSQELGKPRPRAVEEAEEKAAELLTDLPPRIGAFCAGCPHRATVYSLVKATGRDCVFAGDIGCYTLSSLPPFEAYDWVTCMNCGLATGQAMCFVGEDRPVVAYVGDSTFFHSGLPALINAALNGSDVLLVIMDNQWVAMTGHQTTPTTGVDLNDNRLPKIELPGLLRSLGVKYVRTINPYKVRDTIATMKDALERKGLRVIISRGECALQQDRRSRRHPVDYEEYYEIEPSRCQRCDECYLEFACPAIRERQENGDKIYYIEDSLCTRCGACADICLNSAINRIELRRYKASGGAI